MAKEPDPITIKVDGIKQTAHDGDEYVIRNLPTPDDYDEVQKKAHEILDTAYKTRDTKAAKQRAAMIALTASYKPDKQTNAPVITADDETDVLNLIRELYNWWFDATSGNTDWPILALNDWRQKILDKRKGLI